MSELGLDELADKDVLKVEIDGRTYEFRELSIGGLAELQAVIRRIVPNPLVAIRPSLEGQPERIRREIMEFAYRDALNWPPKIETAAGKVALLNAEEGQVAALFEGLKTCDPGATRERAESLYRALDRDREAKARAAREAGLAYDGEGLMMDIMRKLFRIPEPDPDAGDRPKGAGPSPTSRSTGRSYSGSPSNGSA